MKSVLIIGLLLLVVGVAMLAYQGISYTQREDVVKLGPVRVTTEEQKTFPLPPLLGTAAVGLGVILIVVGARRG